MQPRIITQSDGSIYTACLRLRHSYFVCERQWVTGQVGSSIETDRYDSHALHLAVSGEHDVLAYLRALPYHPEVGFMFDGEFACLLSQEERFVLPRTGSLELSRLVCAPDIWHFNRRNEIHPVELLLRQLYHVSQSHGYDRFYIVVEEAWLRPFERRFGLPFRVFGKPHTFPDGTRTVVAGATLEELEAGMRRHSLAKYEWYQQGK